MVDFRGASRWYPHSQQSDYEKAKGPEMNVSGSNALTPKRSLDKAGEGETKRRSQARSSQTRVCKPLPAFNDHLNDPCEYPSNTGPSASFGACRRI